MTTSIRDFERSFVCGASSLIANQYYAVKQAADGTVVLGAASTDKLIGVLQNKPAVDAAALVRFLGTTKAISGGIIAVGAWVTTDANGKVVATAVAGDVVLGKYLGTGAAAAGDVVEIQLGIFSI